MASQPRSCRWSHNDSANHKQVGGKMSILTDLQAELLERNIIVLDGDVDEEMAGYVHECMLRLAVKDNPPITIRITSDGGDTENGLYIYDFLRLYPGKKTGIVIAFARSMAAIVLQACDVRQCPKNSVVLIHRVSQAVKTDDLTDEAKLKETKKEMLVEEEKLWSILRERTKKSRRAIIAVCKKDREMSAAEALNFGLIDEII